MTDNTTRLEVEIRLDRSIKITDRSAESVRIEIIRRPSYAKIYDDAMTLAKGKRRYY